MDDGARLDEAQAKRILRCFDSEWRLERWPAKRSDQIIALWVLWLTMPPTEELSSRDMDDLLKARNGFGDHALLRRDLCDLGLYTRTRDGRLYRRSDVTPLAEAVELMAARG